jgi:protoporphyrinogen oxidase
MRQGRMDGIRTMRQWLEASFGPTLNALFFAPFHEAYTAGLWTEIAPQDSYKSPATGTQGSAVVTYNTRFRYPERGLDHLARRLAERCDLRCPAVVKAIDPASREVHLEDGTALGYVNLISTLPLNRTMELCGLKTAEKPDPSTAVLVLNIGARRGPRCPDVHWLYVPRSRSGFFRVGLYSNVDSGFVPGGRPELVGIYAERAFRDEGRLPREAEREYTAAVIAELQDWGFITEVEAADATWVEVGYTWRRPESHWREAAIETLKEKGVHMVGRYARWTFQGIADSIRDGLVAGAVFRP